jgi:hypothetical protein
MLGYDIIKKIKNYLIIYSPVSYLARSGVMERQASRKKPKKYDRDLILRIMDDWESQGIDKWMHLLKIWDDAIQKSHVWTMDEIKDYYVGVVWPKLINHQVITDERHRVTDNRPMDYFEEWHSMTELNKCRIHNPLDLGNYPYLKIRTQTNSSSGLPLHQLNIRIYEGDEGVNWGNEYVASHTCHTKQCLLCTVKETRTLNNHRNFCVAFTLVDGYLLWTCTHNPKCRDFGSTAFPENL